MRGEFTRLLGIAIICSGCAEAALPSDNPNVAYMSAVSEANVASERAVRYATEARENYERAKVLYEEAAKFHREALAAKMRCEYLATEVQKRKKCPVIKQVQKKPEKETPVEEVAPKKEVIEYSPSDAPL